MTRETLPHIRRSIVIITALLIVMGVIMIYSSSAIYAYERYGDSAFFLKRHLFFISVGLLFMLFGMSLGIDNFKRAAKPVLLFSLFLLFLVLLPGIGVSAGGARRWLRIGFFGFQPSELAKIALILYLADFIARKGYKLKSFTRGYMPAAGIIAFCAFLVIAEPDMGTSVSILFVGFMMILIGGAAIRHMLYTALLGVPFVLYLIIMVPYRLQRVLTFINPWQDPEGAGFQIIQSFLALGSGGFLGVGLGQSKQKLFYLPESHTDFIFSIIGEELGFAGATCVLVIFAALIWQAFRAFFKIENAFNRMIVFGVAILITFEVLVNIGVSTGTLPTKGLPLPFISYGGSSLVFHMFGIGIMLNAMRD